VSEKIQLVRADRKTAGAMALTLIPWGPHSVARDLVSESVAPLDVQRPSTRRGCRDGPRTEEASTSFPWPSRPARWLPSALAISHGPRTLASMIVCQSSYGMSSISAGLL
jgi:hypothetical protein